MITENTKDNTEPNEDAVDGAIDEAIKAETEKLYEEACSNISSCSGICPSHPDFCLLNQLMKEKKSLQYLPWLCGFCRLRHHWSHSKAQFCQWCIQSETNKFWAKIHQFHQDRKCGHSSDWRQRSGHFRLGRSAKFASIWPRSSAGRQDSQSQRFGHERRHSRGGRHALAFFARPSQFGGTILQVWIRFNYATATWRLFLHQVSFKFFIRKVLHVFSARRLEIVRII